MPIDNYSITVPPPCDVRLHDMLIADPDRSIENNELRMKIEVMGGASPLVKSPGPKQLIELQQAFHDV